MATPGALNALEQTQASPADYLNRHVTGDWGDLGAEDKGENEFSLKNGFRILSRYELTVEIRLWVITEADRSVTTLLLPEEY